MPRRSSTPTTLSSSYISTKILPKSSYAKVKSTPKRPKYPTKTNKSKGNRKGPRTKEAGKEYTRVPITIEPNRQNVSDTRRGTKRQETTMPTCLPSLRHAKTTRPCETSMSTKCILAPLLPTTSTNSCRALCPTINNSYNKYEFITKSTSTT